jgi:nucleoside-diphosphate-sugar epimerase
MYKIIEQDVEDIINKINFTQLENKSILITGASGIIGVYLMSCLKRLYKNLNIKVYAWTKSEIDENLSSLFDFDLTIINEDITDIINYKETLPLFDFIIHAAGYGQPGKFLENKIKTIEINTSVTIELIKLLKPDGKFLFISTSELYSGLDSDFIKEEEIGNTKTNHPRASYIEGKRCGEAICHSFISEGKNIKIARLCLAYGAGTKKNDNRVLNSLIQKAIQNDKIQLMDSGNAIRTYCYIADVIEMFWNILFFGKHTTYNVGGVSKISILEMAEMIGRIFDKDVVIPLNDNNELEGSPKIVNISIQKYLDEFKKNVSDFIPFSLGLQRTIQWQKFIYKK